MSIDKTNIQSKISTTIAAANTSCTTSDLVASTRAFCSLISDSCNYITLACDLPDIATGTTPEGTMFYVQELRRPVLATATSWVGLDGRLYRKDADTGPLYAAGRYNYGALLQETLNSNDQCCFNPIYYGGNWISTAAGGNTSFSQGLGIKQDGTMYQWGFVCSCMNNFTCMTSSNCCYSSPVQEFCSATNWRQVSSGECRGSAIKSDGTLWSWGKNNLANGTYGQESKVPVQEFCSDTNWSCVQSSSYDAIALKSDGSLWSMGGGQSGVCGSCSPVRECLNATWISIDVRSGESTATGAHAIKSDGTLWSYGRNCTGQRGDGTSDTNNLIGSPIQEASSSSNWCNVGAGGYSSSAIKTDGTLWTWGTRNPVGNTTCYSSPVQEICSATNWCTVATGTSSLAIKTDGTMWGWGQNYCYSLGISYYTNQTCPIQEVTSLTDWWRVCQYGSLSYAIRNC